MGAVGVNVCPFHSSPHLSIFHSSTFFHPPSLVVMSFLSQNGVSPVMAATYHGHLDAVKALIEAGANVNQADKVSACMVLVK